MATHASCRVTRIVLALGEGETHRFSLAKRLFDGVLYGDDVVGVDVELGGCVVVVLVVVVVVDGVVVEEDVVVVGGIVVVVDGGGAQPVTQKTLYFVSAPGEPSAWMVSLTCHPWIGCGSDARQIQCVGL